LGAEWSGHAAIWPDLLYLGKFDRGYVFNLLLTPIAVRNLAWH